MHGRSMAGKSAAAVTHHREKVHAIPMRRRHHERCTLTRGRLRDLDQAELIAGVRERCRHDAQGHAVCMDLELGHCRLRPASTGGIRPLAEAERPPVGPERQADVVGKSEAVADVEELTSKGRPSGAAEGFGSRCHATRFGAWRARLRDLPAACGRHTSATRGVDMNSPRPGGRLPRR